MNDIQPDKKNVLLLIDDKPSNLRVALHFLKNEHFELLTAHSGKEGLEIARDEIPDLILLDVVMPEIDGFETCRRLKQDELTRDIPVIFMTALADNESKAKGFDLGGVDYIIKPLERREFLMRIRTHVELYKCRQDLERQNSELRLGMAVLETTAEAILVTDADYRISSINPAFTRITGYSKDEVLGQDPSILRSGKHDSTFYELIWQALESEGAWQGEIWNQRKDGTVYPEWLSLTAIRSSNGDVVNYVAVSSDISDKKRLENLLRN